MDLPVATSAKGYEIFLHIVSQMTSPKHVMHLETVGATALLASPGVAL